MTALNMLVNLTDKYTIDTQLSRIQNAAIVLSDKFTIKMPGNPSRKIQWLVVPQENILSLTNAQQVSFVPPCTKRISYIEQKLLEIKDIFPDQLGFIFDMTKALVWIAALDNKMFGNASFFELPHCTLFSDSALFSIPPNSVLPQHTAYAVFENLYHEALHHQLHAFAFLNQEQYLTANIQPTMHLAWRDKTFNITQAIHGLHFYASVIPCRIKQANIYFANRDSQSFAIMLDAINSAHKTWVDLSQFIRDNFSCITKEWQELIINWLAVD